MRVPAGRLLFCPWMATGTKSTWVSAGNSSTSRAMSTVASLVGRLLRHPPPGFPGDAVSGTLVAVVRRAYHKSGLDHGRGIRCLAGAGHRLPEGAIAQSALERKQCPAGPGEPGTGDRGAQVANIAHPDRGGPAGVAAFSRRHGPALRCLFLVLSEPG